jgi:hypothetical protein
MSNISTASPPVKRPIDLIPQIIAAIVGGMIIFSLLIVAVVIGFNISFSGKIYPGVAVAGVIPKIENYLSPEHDFYCSELVALSYKAAGIKVTTKYDASQTTPADLERSKKLVYIGHLKVGQ